MFDFTKNPRMFVGIEDLEPGCEQWVWQISYHMQMYSKRLNTNSDDLIKEMKEALPQKPWSVFPPNSPAKSPDRYFSILLDKSWGEIKQAVILVNPKHKDVLDALERECLRVRAMETAEAPVSDQTIAPRNPAGANQHIGRSGDEKKDVTRPNNTRGNSATYRLSKLKRDYPDVAKRVEAGEFKSVAEAERAAGIGRPVMSRLDRVIAAFQRLSSDDQAKFMELVESMMESNRKNDALNNMAANAAELGLTYEPHVVASK